MSGDSSIVETIKEEVAEMAKAVATDVKAIAAEVADAVAEAKVEPCGDAAGEAVAVKPVTAVPSREDKTSGTSDVDKRK